MTRQDTTTPNLDHLRVLLDAATGEAMQALAATDTDTLLTRYAELTHKMDATERVVGTWKESSRRQMAADLRAQRDLIRAEVLRRTGDL